VRRFVCHSKARNRLSVSENRVLRRIFGPMREEEAGGWVRLNNEFVICTLNHILLRRSNQGG